MQIHAGPTELAYLAGVIDGEGHVTAYENGQSDCITPRLRLTVVVTNTDERLMAWLRRTFGGTVLQRSAPRGRNRAVFVWAPRYWERLPLLRAALPYLVLKREQAEIVIGLEGTLLRGENRKKGLAAITPEAAALRAAGLRRIRELNARGVA